jgi:hypothetical protein
MSRPIGIEHSAPPERDQVTRETLRAGEKLSLQSFVRAKPTDVDTFSDVRSTLDRDGTIRVDTYDTIFFCYLLVFSEPATIEPTRGHAAIGLLARG